MDVYLRLRCNKNKKYIETTDTMKSFNAVLCGKLLCTAQCT